jgi:hypothetical protein
MSEISITYGTALFTGIGPIPLVSVENQQIYKNGEMYTINKVTLTGRIQRTSCNESGFSDPYDKVKLLISRLHRQFRQLSVTETIEYTTTSLYSWNYALVRSINIDDNKWYDWIPYSIEFECYKDGYFNSNGIIDPSREISVENNPDGTLNLTISCSCKGINNLSQAFVNARQFAYDNSAFLQSDLDNLYWTSSILKTATPYLVSEQETFNRINGEVTVVRSYALQDPSLGFTRGVLKFTREANTSDSGETTVTINGSHQGSFRDETTLNAIADDIKGKDWLSIAKGVYATSSDDGFSDPTQEIKNLLYDKVASNSTKNIWSTYDTSTLTFVRNPDCWTKNLDLSGLIIAGTEPSYEGKKLGVAISPRHYLFAWHFKPPLATFTASISGTTMTVTSIASGYVGVNQELTATLITAGTKIVNQLTGTAGSTGTYTVSASQTRASQTIKGNQRFYFLGNDGSLVSRLVTDYLNTFDVGIGLLDSDLPSTVSFLKVLPPNQTLYINLLGKSVFVRDKISSSNVVHKSVVRKMGAESFIPSYDVTYIGQDPDEPMYSFFEDGENGDSDSTVMAILDKKVVLLGYMFGLGEMRNINYDIDSINSMMSTLGGGYSLTYAYPDRYTNLFSSPTNFSLNRDLSNNSVSFSIEFSNKKFSDVYLIDETKITVDNETSTKCAEVSVSIRSELKNQAARWDKVYNYYNSFDFVAYVESKWVKYGNTEKLNYNTKDSSFSENRFQGVIDVGAKFCVGIGQDCGCLQDMKYSYSFTPSLKEYKVGIPINGRGCHYIEDLLVYKRASFSIKGSLIQPICCSYEKTIFELRSRINQISNSLFFGQDKILDSSETSKTEPAGGISFDFSWSAKKDPIIPEYLL